MTGGQNPEGVAVVVLGGINMDLVSMMPRFPQAGESVVGSRFLTYPGGKGANHGSTRMGAPSGSPVRFIKPLYAWMIRSYPGISAMGPVRP